MVKQWYYISSIFLFPLKLLQNKIYEMSFKQIQFFLQKKLNSFIVFNIINVFILIGLNFLRKYYSKTKFFKGIFDKELINDITIVQNYFALYNSDYANHGIGRNIISEVFVFLWLFCVKTTCLKIMQALLQNDQTIKQKSSIPLSFLIIILTIILKIVIKTTTYENILTKLIPLYITKSIITLLIGYIYYCNKLFKKIGISKQVLGPFLQVLFHFTEIMMLLCIISMWNIIYLNDDFRFFEYFFFIYIAEFAGKIKILYLALQFQKARKQTYTQEEERSCTICLENMRSAIYLRCGHCFHKDCIKKLIVHSKSTKCPYCGVQIQFWNDKEKLQFCNKRKKLFEKYIEFNDCKEINFEGFKAVSKKIKFDKQNVQNFKLLEFYNQIYQLIVYLKFIQKNQLLKELIIFITKMNTKNFAQNKIDSLLYKLLQPQNYQQKNFIIDIKQYQQEIIDIINQVKHIINQQPIIIKTENQCKIFGDIHGNFDNLLQFFYQYGSPCQITKQQNNYLIEQDYFDYIFIGDFSDKGKHSLEVIITLFGLKIKFPNKFIILRGNHELDSFYNPHFEKECINRLGEEIGLEYYNEFNKLFDYLPLVCIVQNQYLLLHGFIPEGLINIQQLQWFQRPLIYNRNKFEESVKIWQRQKQKFILDKNTFKQQEQRILHEILWNDPSQKHYKQDRFFQTNPRDDHKGNCKKVCLYYVNDFLKLNNLKYLIRAHEELKGGFYRHNKRIMTIFSALNQKYNNKKAGMIIIDNQGQLCVKIIQSKEENLFQKFKDLIKQL